MCDFSALELAGIAIALDEEEGERNRKRFWVHPMLVKSEGSSRSCSRSRLSTLKISFALIVSLTVTVTGVERR